MPGYARTEAASPRGRRCPPAVRADGAILITGSEQGQAIGLSPRTPERRNLGFGAHAASMGAELVLIGAWIAVISSVALFENVRADLHLYTRREPGLIHRVALVPFNLGLQAVLLYRLSSWLCRHHLSGLAFALNYFGYLLTGAQISGRARIGKGFVVLHPSGVVVGQTTIGENCKLAGRNTIGQRDDSGLRPVIGDDFFAGAGACVLGNVRIGDRVRAGPNVVILESIDDDSTVTCEPARVRSRKKSERTSPHLAATSGAAALRRKRGSALPQQEESKAR